MLKKLIIVIAILIVASVSAGGTETLAGDLHQEAEGQDCAIELMLVLDGSGSIYPEDFQTMKTWSSDLIARFELGTEGAQVGIVQFATSVAVQVPLTADESAISQALNQMYQFGSGTNITEGLRTASEELDARARAGAPRVIIVLTDGNHNEGPPPIPLANQIRDDENHRTIILGVAVGSIDLGEIIAIAGGEYNVIHVPDFEGLKLTLNILHDYSCAVATEGTTELSLSAPPPVDTSSQAQSVQPTSVPTASGDTSAAQPTPIPPTAIPQATAVPTSPPVDIASLPDFPQDTQIVFSSNRDGDSEIFVMDADGSNVQQLTSNKRTDDKPDFSPDGTQITWESDFNGTFDIWVMNTDGSDAHALTDNTSQDWGPSWSPDGSKIAFHSLRGSVTEIWVMNADGSDPVRITQSPNSIDRSASWSPDGQSLVFYSDRDEGREIYTVNLETGVESRLTDNGVYDGQPDWSPDGSTIIFASTRTRTDNFPDICMMNTDGSNAQCIGNSTGTDDDPAFSPDGQWIVMESGRTGNFEIWAMRVDGSQAVQLTNDPARDWSADWGVKP